MKSNVRIGVVCLARKTFDYKAADKIFKDKQKDLLKIENTEFIFEKNLVIELIDARKAAITFSEKNVDAVIIISGTFHLGHLALEINKILNKPIHLWAFNELPYDGGKIRLNSVCGLNLNASNLYKAGIKNFSTSIGELDLTWIDAIRLIRTLNSSHVGIAGFRAHGFFNLSVNDLSVYSKLGLLIDHYELSDIFNCDTTSDQTQKIKKELSVIFSTKTVSAEQVSKVALLCAKFENFLELNKLDALAVRCWPEFASDFGISPCAAMSYLQSKGKILACEGDIEGAISMLAHTAVGAKTPFLFDFSQVNLEKDFALLWHCGVAPCNLRNPEVECSLDTYFAGGKGVTADFVLKSGDISILRFDSAHDKTRIFLNKAKVHNMSKELKGTYAKATFETSTKDVLNKIINNGIAHHASMVYGDYIEPFIHFSKIKGFEVIR